jgi:hypothetical protein
MTVVVSALTGTLAVRKAAAVMNKAATIFIRLLLFKKSTNVKFAAASGSDR